MLLTELAANCAYSASSVRCAIANPRSKRVVLAQLFQSLSPDQAAFLTQIILKDLRPILYPLQETHYSTSLLQYNTNSIIMLTKEDAMKIWDPAGKMLRAYSVRATLDDAAEFYEDPNAAVEPRIGVPIAVCSLQIICLTQFLWFTIDSQVYERARVLTCCQTPT